LPAPHFGTFFILIDQVSSRAIYWPLVAARVASITFIATAILANRRFLHAPVEQGPSRHSCRLIFLTGLLETSGNVFFALATAAGRLDVASVLASLYPAGTVLLAWLVSKSISRPGSGSGLLPPCWRLSSSPPDTGRLGNPRLASRIQPLRSL
jgi:hypothetical protein